MTALLITIVVVWAIAASIQQGSKQKTAAEVVSVIDVRHFIGSKMSLEQLRTMHHIDFEALVGAVFQANGHSTHLTGKGADGGRDVIAIKDGALMFIECKQSKHKFSIEEMRSFDTVIRKGKAQKGYVVALAGFTRPAAEHASRGRKLKCIDGQTLIELIEGKSHLL